jgi:hypothetical protein
MRSSRTEVRYTFDIAPEAHPHAEEGTNSILDTIAEILAELS